jgi:hypothetical protein
MKRATALLSWMTWLPLLAACASESDATSPDAFASPGAQGVPTGEHRPSEACTHMDDFESDSSGAAPSQWRTIELGAQADTLWSVVEVSGGQALQAVSESAASCLALSLPADPNSAGTAEQPPSSPAWLHWRWRVDSLADVDTDERSRAGDDFAARVLVTFANRPGASLLDSMQDAAARLASHEELPAAAIAYVFARGLSTGTEFTSPYSERVATIVLRGRGAEIGRWYTEQRDVLADFERLFGKPISRPTGIQLLTDTDDAGGRACALYDDICLCGPSPP